MREFEHITLARILLAGSSRDRDDGRAREASELLGRLLRAAEDGERHGTVIEILVLQAISRQMAGDIRGGQVPLEAAVSMAEPQGYVRMFVDEGGPMAALLAAALKRGIAPTYVRDLLAAFDRGRERTSANRALVEPLSERELEVLRLLATDIDGPAIARELVVSLNTVRSHTKSIYAKLGVNNRRAAARRGEELDLLSRGRDH
jgi:LuxR family maltose regulon positive regulatory protein